MFYQSRETKKRMFSADLTTKADSLDKGVVSTMVLNHNFPFHNLSCMTNIFLRNL